MLKQGNSIAFNEIYERYWLRLYIVALKRLKSPENARDIIQDLFVSVWQKKETLVIKVSLSAYLSTAIKYQIINHIEANIVKRNYLNSLDKSVIDYDNSTAESIALNDLEQLIESGISNLSPRVKEVFELSRKGRLSVNEIAQKLNVSEQTVKNQMSKAIKTLRLHINNITISHISLAVLYSYCLEQPGFLIL